MNPRIVENQRRIMLELIGNLHMRLRPGLPFVNEIKQEFARHRQFGSRDRRLYRELVFTWLRFRPWFDKARGVDIERALDLLILLAPDSPPLLPLQAVLGSPGGIARKPWHEVIERLNALVPGAEFTVPELLPSWFRSHCPALFENDEAWLQTRRTPFWLRAQRGSADELVHELARDGIDASTSHQVPSAVKVHEHIDLEEHRLITGGRAEIQDIGSQALLLMVNPDKGEHWLDLCAGGGGKTLQLAAMVGPTGRVTAHDVRRESLLETRRRLARAGLQNVHTEPVLPEAGIDLFDGVLVDAPCSASGTWRRHPFLRHQLTGVIIKRYTRDQLRILHRGAQRVRPGGRLVYATCSLSRQENEDVVSSFLKDNRDFRLEPPAWLPAGAETDAAGRVTLMPSLLDGDGYFLACMRREA